MYFSIAFVGVIALELVLQTEGFLREVVQGHFLPEIASSALLAAPPNSTTRFDPPPDSGDAPGESAGGGTRHSA